jgi:hypothetical protein
VPRHAQSAAAVAQLFCGPSFIDEVDYTVEKEEERFCYTVWIWTDAPNDLALEGKLQVEEPLVHSDEYLSRLGSMEERSSPVRDDPIATFDYKVFIHLDRDLYYNPLPDSPERMSFESVVTGIPADDPSASACPVRFDFTWCLGMRDGESLGAVCRCTTGLEGEVIGRTGRHREVTTEWMVGQGSGSIRRRLGMI